MKVIWEDGWDQFRELAEGTLVTNKTKHTQFHNQSKGNASAYPSLSG